MLGSSCIYWLTLKVRFSTIRHLSSKVEHRVEATGVVGALPTGATKKTITLAEWWNGIHAGFRNQCPQGLESSNLSLATKLRLYGETVNAASLNLAGGNPLKVRILLEPPHATLAE